MLMKMSNEDRRADKRFWLARASYPNEIQSAEQKGRVEQQQELARKLKAKGLDLNLIAEISGLTIAEIEIL